jgi:hypothetical protein
MDQTQLSSASLPNPYQSFETCGIALVIVCGELMMGNLKTGNWKLGTGNWKLETGN